MSETKREIFYPLDHSICGYNKSGWVRLKPGARIRVSSGSPILGTGSKCVIHPLAAFPSPLAGSAESKVEQLGLKPLAVWDVSV